MVGHGRDLLLGEHGSVRHHAGPATGDHGDGLVARDRARHQVLGAIHAEIPGAAVAGGAMRVEEHLTL
jgi:hypothetical protein